MMTYWKLDLSKLDKIWIKLCKNVFNLPSAKCRPFFFRPQCFKYFWSSLAPKWGSLWYTSRLYDCEYAYIEPWHPYQITMGLILQYMGELILRGAQVVHVYQKVFYTCVGMGDASWWSFLELLSRYPITCICSSLHLIWTSDTHISSMGTRSLVELQGLDLKIGYQESSSRNGHQGDMPYCMV